MISLIKPSRLSRLFEETFEASDVNFLVYEYTGDDLQFPVELFEDNIIEGKINFAFVDDAYEGLLRDHDIQKLQQLEGIDEYIVLTSNAKLQEKNCYYLNYHLYNTWYDYTDVFNTECFINTDKRNKKYICLNRQERWHRFETVEFLHKHDFLKDGYVSCSVVPRFDQPSPRRYLDRDLRDFKLTDELEQILPLVLDLTPEEMAMPHFGYSMPNLWINYYDSYFGVITERDFYSHNYIGFTEKTLKSILYCQPFVIVGLPGTLELLKYHGFKTFEGFIDETYDTEIDHNKRMILALEEVKKLNEMSYEELYRWYHSMTDILEHNYNRYQEICRNDIVSLTKHYTDIIFEQLKFANI